MSEKEAAVLFNKELDVLLRDGRPPFPSHDEDLIRSAGVLAAADFSGDSRIREELRSRLTGESGGTGFFALAADSFVAGTFKVVFAAACLLLVVTQVVRQPVRRPAAPEPVTAPVQATRPAPAAPRAASAGRPPRAAPRPPAPSPAAEAVFASIPMSVPSGELLDGFPIVSVGTEFPIATAQVREVEVPGGSDLVMETEDVVLIIETRETSHEEIFERRII